MARSRRRASRPLGAIAPIRSVQGITGAAAAIRSRVPPGLRQGTSRPSGSIIRSDKRRQRERLAAAVGVARDPDPPRVGDPLVDQAPDQRLRVADLVAGVGEVDVAPGAGGRVGESRVGGAAGPPEPARGVGEDRVSAPRPGEGVVGVGRRRRVEVLVLAVAEAVDLDHQRQLAGGGRGQRDRGVERHPVPGRDQARAHLQAAHRLAVGEPEWLRRRRGRRDRGADQQRRDKRAAPEVSAPHRRIIAPGRPRAGGWALQPSRPMPILGTDAIQDPSGGAAVCAGDPRLPPWPRRSRRRRSRSAGRR